METTKITASTTYYTTSLWFTGSGFTETRMSEYRWFNIDNIIIVKSNQRWN